MEPIFQTERKLRPDQIKWVSTNVRSEVRSRREVNLPWQSTAHFKGQSRRVVEYGS
jgi:hypothetical protein